MRPSVVESSPRAWPKQGTKDAKTIQAQKSQAPKPTDTQRRAQGRNSQEKGTKTSSPLQLPSAWKLLSSLLGTHDLTNSHSEVHWNSCSILNPGQQASCQGLLGQAGNRRHILPPRQSLGDDGFLAGGDLELREP